MFRVLIVDDDPDFVSALDALIASSFSAEIIACAEADVAIAHLQSEQFDLAIVDQVMPNTNGFQVLAEARHHQDHCYMIICSGYPIPARMFSEHFAVLTKPISKGSLERAFRAAGWALQAS